MQSSHTHTRNFIISGTSLWNPGDDFVREGVVQVLREVFDGGLLNFHFYNFNPDCFPKTKFKGFGNEVSAGDLEQCREFIDAIIIAGLSAGEEIKDLYRWVIANGLEDRVVLIGAGYENPYCAGHIRQEPEATIFRRARLIIGRTASHPAFIDETGTPYVHLNCPALLSVKAIKEVPAGRKIERIGFSIQLPHGTGIVNQTCDERVHALAVEVLSDLARTHQVEVVAHHKSEYFHFLRALKDTGIPVVYSSFHHDLHEAYRRHDLVVTTRLHASLFANGHGIPGIILNDTDRHTHALDGFPHSTWVNTRAAFDAEFARISRADLRQVAEEMKAFKSELTRKYVDTLRGLLTAGTRRNNALSGTAAETYAFDSEKREQALVRRLVKPGMTVFDVGAHAGKYTRLFSLLVGEAGRVFAFEPTPASARKLAALVSADGLRNVTLIAKAVCEQEGAVTLHEFPEEYSSWNGLGRPAMEDPRDPSRIVPHTGAVEVPATTLAAFCRAQGIERIDYLKLDVEGAEVFALQGARELLRKQAIRCLQFEISRKMLDGLGVRAKGVFDFLAAHGYECREIHENGLLGRRATDSEAFYENYLAVPAAQPVAPRRADLPVHFFTIVLNGQPFIRHHIEQFRQLPFAWHWHVIEGVAELNHDTAWSRAHGGRIPDTLHRGGLSVDGTTGYLDELQRRYPENVTVHRPPAGRFWDGKREMVNAPLAAITGESLLWQVDADELWTASQFIRARELFLAHPEKTAALFFCHYFVGPSLVVTSRDTYGNNSSYEWRRVWRFQPGDRWLAHEPPRLMRPVPGGEPLDVGAINPFLHADTERMGLLFQHYAYATAEQARFKQDYYGYAGAVGQWRKLQATKAFPCRLADHFAWVRDEAIVDTADNAGVRRLAPDDWFADAQPSTSMNTDLNPERILFVRTDAIGDAVLASAMLEPLRRRFSSAKLAVLCQRHVAELFVACPFVDSVICFERAKVEDENALRAIVSEIAAFKPDLVLNSVRSRDALSEKLTHAFSETCHIGLDNDLCNATPEQHAEAWACYQRLIASPGGHRPELQRHEDFLTGLGIVATNLTPKVWTTTEDEAVGSAFFAEHNLDPLRTIALFPGAQHDMRVYPGYAAALAGLKDFDFLVFGDPSQQALAEGLTKGLPGRAWNLAGRTTLREMAALLRRCRLYIGAESAGAHMACALGVPNVVVLGGGHFGRFMPYSALTSAVALPMDCFGCNWRCRHSRAHCVKDVAPELLAKAVQQTLDALSARPRIFVPAGSLNAPQDAALRPLLEAHPAVVKADFIEVAVNTNCAPATIAPRASLPPSIPARAARFLETAESYRRAGNLDGMRSALEWALDLAPDHPEVLAERGRMLVASEVVSQPDRGPSQAAAVGQTASADKSPTPLLSVIVSCYNSEKLIRGCLENLVAQTLFERAEVIVIDSGSPQNERAIVEEFQQRHPNILYHRTGRETLYATWNRGVRLARGEFITNANTDDAHRPDAMGTLIAALEAHPAADFAYADCAWTGRPNDTFAAPAAHRVVRYGPYQPAAAMFYCVLGCFPMWRRRAFARAGLFDRQFVAVGDYDFLVRCVRAQLRAVHVPEVLSLFYQNPAGLSQQSSRSEQELQAFYARCRKETPIECLYRVEPGNAASAANAWVAHGNLALQFTVPWLDAPLLDLEYALQCYGEALRLQPQNVPALHNAAVALARYQRTDECEPFLARLSPPHAEELRAAILAGEAKLMEATAAPAVEALEFQPEPRPEFGEILVTASENSLAVAVAPPPKVTLPVRWRGPFFNPSGYASEAINFVLPLAGRLELGIFHHNNLYSEKFVAGLPEVERDTLFALRDRHDALSGGIVISHNPANGFQRLSDGAYHVGRTMFETDRIPPAWVTACNQMDEVWVPSRFNAGTFAAAGVERDKLVVMPGAVDVHEFDPARHAPLPLPNKAAFNFLAIFEWSSRKAWDVLLAAYLREFSAADDVCLFLRAYQFSKPDGDPTAALWQLIREHATTLGLGDKPWPRLEIIADQVPLADLPRLYRAVDCLVGISRGEGWGRPQHEAMAMGLPVIATNWSGNTEFMDAENSYLLDYELADIRRVELELWQYRGQRWANPSEKHLRETMRRVQQNPAEAREKGRRARAHIVKHFSRETVADKVLQRLAAIERKLSMPALPAVVARTLPAGTDAQHRAQPGINVAWEGTFLDAGSLSHVNRELTAALERQEGIALTRVGSEEDASHARALHPDPLPSLREGRGTSHGASGREGTLSDGRALATASLAPRGARGEGHRVGSATGNTAPIQSQSAGAGSPSSSSHVTIRHAWPPNWAAPASGAWVMIQPWEYGVLPVEWVQRLARVDEVWCYTDYVRRVYVDSGVDPAKVKVVPLGIDPEKFHPEAPPLALATKKKFKFLFVGGTISRKGPDALLEAFLENFTAVDDVCLVIKDFGGNGVYAGQTIADQIAAAQAKPGAPEILHLTDELPPEQMPSLYTACDCLAHPYRGEGFGLPVLEAMACGLPVIVTGGGATDDFATDEFAYRLPALRQPLADTISGMKLAHTGWLLEPVAVALGAHLRRVFQHRDEARAKGRAASEHVRREWTWAHSAQIAARRLQDLRARKQAQEEEVRARRARKPAPIPLPPVAKIGDLAEARELLGQKQFVPAWNATIKAIQHRPFHPEGYLLLAGIALTSGDIVRAGSCAERARQLAPKGKAAAQFLKALPAAKGSPAVVLSECELPPLDTPRLSVCLITKNEERFLPQCLKSIRDLAHQIVVVDTGSTDRTVELAHEAGAEVFAFAWNDDFSAARNAALAHATGDWILILDADEELPPAHRDTLRKELRAATVMAYRLPIVDKGREAEGCNHVPRLFRNAPGLFFAGRIHEQVSVSLEARRAEWGLEHALGASTLLHHGYDPELTKNRNKIGRNLWLLQHALEDAPNDPNLLMNFGLELVRAGHTDDGLEQYREAFEILSVLPRSAVSPELREALLTQYATHLLSVRKFGRVIKVLTSPLAKAGGLTASQLFLLGMALIEMRQFTGAAEQFRQCLAKRNKPALTPIHKDIHGAAPNHCLALCLMQLKQTAAAEQAFGAALQDEPQSVRALLDFARFRALGGQPVEALKMLHQAVAHDATNTALWALGGQIALNRVDFLEFALDWTGEALKACPKEPALVRQRAEALLLNQDAGAAAPLWRALAVDGRPDTLAATVLCETLSGGVAATVPTGSEAAVSQAFMQWYRKLVALEAGGTLAALNGRVEELATVLPGAAKVLQSVLREAELMPA